MKRYFILFWGMLYFAGNTTQAQVTSQLGRSSFGVFGSLNFQNINGKDANGNTLQNSLVLRFNAGINYEIPIAPEFYFQPGIQFITKGTKGEVIFTQNNIAHLVKREIKMSYVEVPLNLVFKPMLGSGYVVLGFGPYVGYAIGGKAIFSGASAPANADLQFVKTAPANDDNNLLYFKRTDMGANFFAGYELGNGLNVLLNAQLGLININSKTSTKMANKNTGFGVTLGFRF